MNFNTNYDQIHNHHHMRNKTATSGVTSIQIIPTAYSSSSANSSCLSTTSNSLSSSPSGVSDRLTSSTSSSSSSSSQPIDILQRQMSTSNDYSDDHHHNSNEDFSDSSMSDDNGHHINTSNNIDNTNIDINENGIKMEMERGGDGGGNSSGNTSSNNSRVNRFFPDKVVDVLNKWFFENQEYPYPDDNMTNVLAREANISAKQVRKWFANKRVRSNKCLKTTCRTKKDRRQTVCVFILLFSKI